MTSRCCWLTQPASATRTTAGDAIATARGQPIRGRVHRNSERPRAFPRRSRSWTARGIKRWPTPSISRCSRPNSGPPALRKAAGRRWRSEDGDRIERRPGSLLNLKRRGREQEFVPAEPLCRLRHTLQIEIVEDVDAERHERQLVDRQADRLRQRRRRHVVPFVRADERHTSLFAEEPRVRLLAPHTLP